MGKSRVRRYVAAVCLLTGEALAGPIWDTDLTTDVGRLRAEAKAILSQIYQIRGKLSDRRIPRGGGDFEDVYLIYIPSLETCPAGFRATTDRNYPTDAQHPGGSTTDFDTQLWLFDANGFGLLGNDDDPALGFGESTISFPSNDGTGVTFPGAGYYYLAISGGDAGGALVENDPVSAGGPIFSMASDTEISGPDGAGGGSPFIDWSATGQGDVGFYDIFLTCPEPTSLALWVWVGMVVTKRRSTA